MAKFHFFMGTTFFGIFLATGVYMFLGFPELYQQDQAIRMMYRSTHIYILMSALINLTVFLVYHAKISFYSNKISGFSSVLLLISPVLMFIGFVVEPPQYLIERPVSFWGVIFLVVGVLSMVTNGLLATFIRKN